MAAKLVDKRGGSVQTTDATQTTVITYAVPDATVAHLRAIVTARRPSNGDSAGFDLGGAVKRHGGGGATLVGTVSSVVTKQDAGAATWAATMTVSGNDLLVRVTGAAATIEWLADLDVYLYTP